MEDIPPGIGIARDESFDSSPVRDRLHRANSGRESLAETMAATEPVASGQWLATSN